MGRPSKGDDRLTDVHSRINPADKDLCESLAKAETEHTGKKVKPAAVYRKAIEEYADRIRSVLALSKKKR